jgi:hypothetical protein
MARILPQQTSAAVSGAVYDVCMTPPHGVARLLPYLPAGARIWECASGDGWISRVLERAGHSVISTDYRTGHDFFEYAPDADSYDVIVTNPPYSLKYKFLEHCYQLGKPFALLVPFTTIASGTALKLYRRHGWEELRLTKRINFSMPNTGFANSGAQFAVLWLCWHLLPQPIIVSDVPDPLPEHRLIKPRKATDSGQRSLFDLDEAA